MLDVTVPPNTSAEIWIPMTGREDSVVREGGVPLAGQRRAGGVGARSMRTAEGCAVVAVGAGQYSFEVDAR